MHTDSEQMGASNVELWLRSRLQAPGLVEPLRAALDTLVREIEAERQSEHRFFLSVVIRTQAKRWEQLKDALLCLNAQTDQDFEVLLMLHNVEDEEVERVEQLVAEYPASFADRVRPIPVRGGGRARPLEVSLSHLRSEYVAFYDDDDLLMADWVEAFHEGARMSPGQVIRSNVAVQSNRPEVWRDGAQGQRSISPAAAEYVSEFDFLTHLKQNHTPFMGLAFPTAFFLQWGERFDESLPVCEDWDVLLRASSLMGVTSMPQLTAIYRRWEGVATSYTAHLEQEWRDAETRIRSRFNSAPALLSTGFVEGAETQIATEVAIEHELAQQLSEVLNSTSWKMTAPLRRALGAARGGRRSGR